MRILKCLAFVFVVPFFITALFLIALRQFQDRLLYFPSQVALEHYTSDDLQAWPQLPSGSESNIGKQANVPPQILGLIGTPPKDKPTIGTVVVFHGNAGHAGHRSYYASMLTELGIRTILAEYPGYGPRSGKPSEDVLISDGVEIVRQVHQLYGKPVWLLGESLGAGVAAAVVKEAGALVQGIVLITPWNRLIDVAVFHYPYLPVRSLLKSNYDSIDALLEFDGPKLVIVADDDAIVPRELGLNLYRQTSQPKRLVRVENAGHNDWINFVDREFWQNNMGWLIDSSRK